MLIVALDSFGSDLSSRVVPVALIVGVAGISLHTWTRRGGMDRANRRATTEKGSAISGRANRSSARGQTRHRGHPRAQLVALDWAPVVEVTREHAERAGLKERFSTIAGNAFKVDLGSDYDVVLIPNFLHHFKLEDCVPS